MKNEPPVIRLIVYNPHGRSKLLIGNVLYYKDNWDSVSKYNELVFYLSNRWYGRALALIKKLNFIRVGGVELNKE